MKKSILFAAVAALALASCHKQSELNFEDIQGSATIKGVVNYNPDNAIDGENYIQGYVPAAGQTVVAKIEYSQYDANATGTKQITTTTNDKGEYTLKIPVGQKPITVTVQPRSFEAAYNGNLNPDGTILPTTALYETVSKNIDVMNGETHILATFRMNPSNIAEITSRNTTVTVTGKVLTKVEVSITEGNGIIGAEAGETASTGTARIEFTCNNKTLVYNNIKLDEEGAYTLTANLYDAWNLSNTRVTVYGNTYMTDEFRHFYYVIEKTQYASQTISGIFQESGSSNNLSQNTALTKTHKMPDVIMTFTPTDYESIRGIGGEIDYDKDGIRLYSGFECNPFGWSY